MLRKTFGFVAVLFLMFVVAPAGARAQGGHEYAPIEEKTVNYKDWTLKDLKTGEPFNLRKWAADKKLVLVVYFAPWCKNWRYEAPVLSKLYEKYKPHGLEVVAVSEYASLDDARKFFGDKGVSYPVVVESDSQDARTKTMHYAYRQASGDKRNWGSPYNVFLEPAALKTVGDTLTETAWIVGGVLIDK
jgi:thiol-disulfide isomerase/thioredoxin